MYEYNQFNYNRRKKIFEINLSHILIVGTILFVITALLFSKNVFAKSFEAEYESNQTVLNIQNIISENADIYRFKEQVTKEYDVPFEIQYFSNASLPKDEEVTIQEGAIGKENVTTIRTYEDKKLLDEVVLSRENTLEPIPQIINIGTSEFLKKHQVHIGDTMYFVETSSLKDSASENANSILTIKHSFDVVLLELPSEDWCKVSFDGMEGYIESANLTSASSTPEIIAKNKTQRALQRVSIDMELNKPSGLSLEDYEKIFTGLPNDTNHIFENNYKAFYEVENKYNINGIFLAALAIHESGWGTSKIANDKYNLFGYGAYDRSPYEYSITFTDYTNGIETVAKFLVKNYLNPAGTIIYDGEIAEGKYYDEGPFLANVNKRYSTDVEWHTKVFNYMQLLYDRI